MEVRECSQLQKAELRTHDTQDCQLVIMSTEGRTERKDRWTNGLQLQNTEGTTQLSAAECIREMYLSATIL